MPFRNPPYGVYKAKIITWDTRLARLDKFNGQVNRQPHGYIYFYTAETTASDITNFSLPTLLKPPRGGSQTWYSSAVNVKSGDMNESRIVFWTGFLTPDSRLVGKLKKLEKMKFYSGEEEPHLDFLRDEIILLKTGSIRPWSEPGDQDDIIDAWDDFFEGAMPFEKSELFLFGQQYDDQKGIHQIHMNQGNFKKVKESWWRENGVGQDGGVVVKTADGQWKYFFTAFASQAAKTDADGRPISEEPPVTPMIKDILEGDVIIQPTPRTSIRIDSALANPKGPDNDGTPGSMEKVILVNLGGKSIDVSGWSISNSRGGGIKKIDKLKLAAGEKKEVATGPECYLSNKGGTIKLLNSDNLVIDSVLYTKDQASIEGSWIKFSS